jgi:hypothetical protein
MAKERTAVTTDFLYNYGQRDFLKQDATHDAVHYACRALHAVGLALHAAGFELFGFVSQ